MTNSRRHFSLCAGLIAGTLSVLFGQTARSDSTFESKGVKIAYSVQGKGVPVVLIHGFLSSGWINWELPGISKALEAEHQVVRIDMPAHGGSDKPGDEDAYGLELVEHTVRLMDHLKIKQAHIAGYSMGGIIAAKLTVKHPDRVLSTALCGMGWLREGSVEQKFFAAGGRDGKPTGLCFKSLAKLVLTEEEIKSIKTPVVILFGSDDFIKRGYTEPLKKVRPDWNVIEIADANHISCIMKPKFREELQSWIDKQSKEASKSPNSTK